MNGKSKTRDVSMGIQRQIKKFFKVTWIIVFVLCLATIFMLYENLFKSKACLKNVLKDYMLVIRYDEPYYKNNKVHHSMYDQVFGSVLTCGPEANALSGRNKPDIELDNSHHYGYHCLAMAQTENKKFKGYFLVKSNALLNWWTILKNDFTKLWQDTLPEFFLNTNEDHSKKNLSDFEMNALDSCHKYYDVLKRLKKISNDEYNGPAGFSTYIFNGQGQGKCSKGTTNVIYVPSKHIKSYSVLSRVAHINRIHETVAVSNIFQTLDHTNKILVLHTTEVVPYSKDIKNSNLFWYVYEESVVVNVVYPLLIDTRIVEERDFNLDKLNKLILTKKNALTAC